MNTVAASIPVLRWAMTRAQIDDSVIAQRFRHWPLWLAGTMQPTLRQLEDFARLTHTPVGYFFLPEPPNLVLPVQDFRTIQNKPISEPSSALLDTLYLCQQRQQWFREYAQLHRLDNIAFVGSSTVAQPPEDVASLIRQTLGLSVTERKQCATWTDALRQLINKTEDIGILIMISGIVGSNSHRKLQLDEFRGFALADELAPLIFVNATDSKAGQMFTIAHELAHIWLGESGVSSPDMAVMPEQHIERWCNQVAAELLVPLAAVQDVYQADAPVEAEMQRLAKWFKVSTLVIVRRLFDARYIDRATFVDVYNKERNRVLGLSPAGGGGNFYHTLGVRTGKRFARAVLSSTLEGQTLFQEAFRMLGIKKSKTFYQAAQALGVMQ